MTTPERPHAVIAGGSPSGLVAATTLRATGWDVAVFERSADALDSRGGGIVLQPEVLAAFRFAGVRHTDALGVRSDDRIYLNAEDGAIHRSRMPQTRTAWNMLYGAMRSTLPAGCIHAGERLVSFTQSGDRMTTLIASGRMERSDLLIGADGAGSTVRSQLLPGVKPAYAGYVAWRGLVPGAALGSAAATRLGSSFVFQEGRDHLLLEYRGVRAHRADRRCRLRAAPAHRRQHDEGGSRRAGAREGLGTRQRRIDNRLAAWEAEQLSAGSSMGAWGVSIGNQIMGVS